MTSAAPILTGTGSISRLTFLISGILLAMFKQGLDIGLSVLAFHRTVRAFNYWFPFDRAVALTSLGAADYKHLLAIVAVAVPFIWIGVCLTLARLPALECCGSAGFFRRRFLRRPLSKPQIPPTKVLGCA